MDSNSLVPNLFCVLLYEDCVMQRLLLTALSVAVLSNFQAISAVNSQIATRKPLPVSTLLSTVEPFTLVHLGYEGYFGDQGIPGYGGFVTAANQQSVTAKRLIEVAIKKGRLSSAVWQDTDYLHAVEIALDSFRYQQ